MTTLYDPVVYDATVQGVPGDVEFFVRLAREARAAGLPVLELACGTGRVSVPVARDGVAIVGLDASPAMLARAREKAAGLPKARWVLGDMRDFDLPERFGLVAIPFRSFQHLLTVDDQLACLACIRRHLAPGGRLVINVFNPDIVRIAQWLTARKGTLQLTREGGGGWKRWETADYAPATQELDVTLVDERLDEGGVVVSRVYRGLKLRYAFRYEMEHLFARAGFQVEALYGDFFEGPFQTTSPEMVWLVRPAG
jgi:SAM-dependent methyltransferase